MIEIEIQGRKIGDGYPVFFIAEAGVNHNGSLELALQLVSVAAEAGADAVKFQTFNADSLNTRTAPKSSYHVETTGTDEMQSWYELLKTQELSREMHIELKEYCLKKKIIFLSTPYDHESADLLEELGIPAFKTASTDTNNIPLLKYLARKGRPMIISTAMATMQEVEYAVDAVRGEGLDEIVVLQCTGNYPARLEDSNLRVMETYRRQLNCLVGFSDHVSEMINPIAATAFGACVYEKHFTVDKELPGPDHRMSLDSKELKDTIKAIRLTEKALGRSEKIVLDSEKENRVKLRKSLVAAVNIPKGTRITDDMIAVKRPGNGIPPSELENILHRESKMDIHSDSHLKESMFI
ncbi:MAG: N-acetylneuraminate synthase [Candidatus Scalindua sp.]|jgi:N,N'-diacetyllegionaminate synthase|nr:N-acetylneuraminate synthase [Candidatus Scalindua sp.]MBT7618325.1 N-acetylneuraminate synthase [Calditrichota bacterium]